MSAPSTARSGIKQTIKALINAGWVPTYVDYGDGEGVDVSTATEALDEIEAVDDAFLIVSNGKTTGWVRFVLGNSPDEVICDYTVDKFDEVMDALYDKWSN